MIRLDDIAGYKNEKEEIRKIINLLTNYKKYEDAGIYVPKGLVLQGPPGCGKTLFAKAIAGECNVPFFTFQAESDAKVSLEKLTKLFEDAKAKTPSIVYIDEIDKLTSHRFFDSDAVRTMVQFLLTELDGLSNSQGILVIASTNYYNDLPDSLVRSGRMDKKICIDYPDLESRIAILDYYIKGHKIFKDVNIKSLALKIKGMSGADIKTLINNALIEYIDSKEVLTVDSFVDLINQMNFDDIGRRWNSKSIVKKVLIHEAGHSLVHYYLTGNCGSISGVRYGGSAGHTDFDDDDEILEELEEVIEASEEEGDANVSKQDLTNQIASLFAGMIAEEIFYGSFDSGASSDIIGAEHTFRRMANFYFLDSRFIELDVERIQDPYLVRKFLNTRDRLFKKQRRICKHILTKHKDLVSFLVDTAMDHEDTLNATQIKNCIDYYNQHRKELHKRYLVNPIIKEEENEDAE